MLGVGAVAWIGWVLGTLIGAVGAGWIGDPARFGVGFAMPAMFTALFIALAENRRHVVIGLAGRRDRARCCRLLSAVGVTLSPSWFIVIASMARGDRSDRWSGVRSDIAPTVIWAVIVGMAALELPRPVPARSPSSRA